MVARAVYSYVITKFSRMGRLLHLLTHGAPLARFARQSSAIIILLPYLGLDSNQISTLVSTLK